MDILTFPFWSMKKKVAKAFLNFSSGGHMHSFLLSKYLRVELLSHRIGICPALVAIPKQLTKVLVAFSTPISNVCEFQLIDICINTWYRQFFPILAILIHVQWYLIVALIWIFLMTTEFFSVCFLKIWISAFMKCLFKYLPFSYCYLYFLLICMSYLYSLDRSWISDKWCAYSKYLLQLSWFLFILLMVVSVE